MHNIDTYDVSNSFVQLQFGNVLPISFTCGPLVQSYSIQTGMKEKRHKTESSLAHILHRRSTNVHWTVYCDESQEKYRSGI